MLAGRTAEAVAVMRKEPRENWRLAGLTMVLFDRDRQKSAGGASDRVLAELLEKYSGNMTYNLGYVYAYRGDADSAFEWLEKAVEVEDAGLGEILSQPLFENLYEDPRWLPFLRKLGRAPDQLSEIEFSIRVPG
jgi:tetratricopeptide (TPR) repeat protein